MDMHRQHSESHPHPRQGGLLNHAQHLAPPIQNLRRLHQAQVLQKLLQVGRTLLQFPRRYTRRW